jgi:hypothetical protein
MRFRRQFTYTPSPSRWRAPPPPVLPPMARQLGPVPQTMSSSTWQMAARPQVKPSRSPGWGGWRPASCCPFRQMVWAASNQERAAPKRGTSRPARRSATTIVHEHHASCTRPPASRMRASTSLPALKPRSRMPTSFWASATIRARIAALPSGPPSPLAKQGEANRPRRASKRISERIVQGI